MLKKIWFVFLATVIPFIILIIISSSLVHKVPDYTESVPFPFLPNSIVVDDLGIIYISSSETTQVMAFDQIEKRIKYVFKVKTEGAIDLIEANDTSVWLIPYRNHKVQRYEKGILVEERPLTAKDQGRTTINALQAKDSNGNKYKLTSVLGITYVKKATMNNTSEKIAILPTKIMIVNFLFVISKIILGICSFILFLAVIVQTQLTNLSGEDRLFKIKEILPILSTMNRRN